MKLFHNLNFKIEKKLCKVNNFKVNNLLLFIIFSEHKAELLAKNSICNQDNSNRIFEIFNLHQGCIFTITLMQRINRSKTKMQRTYLELIKLPKVVKYT